MRADRFENDVVAGKGFSFGMGRKNVPSLADRRHKKDKTTPSPNSYKPVIIGKAPQQYSIASKAQMIGFIEKKKNEGKPGPGNYIEGNNLNHFSNDNQNSRVKNP